MPRKLALVTFVAAALVVPGHAQQNSALANLKTTAEASDYKSTSTYDDVVKFMKAVDDASPIVFYTTYGTTYEGRPMPLAIVGTGIKDGSPASVKASGKLRVHIQANIHAGEVEGKESAQNLLRALAMGQHADWLQNMVLLVTPIFNADGNEKFSMTNRSRQNGPINGEGTRANGQGININRDSMKLETPEGRAFVKLWNDYDPQVGFDLHTSDGSTHGYYLTYAPPLNPDTSDAIMAIMKNDWFPFVTTNIKSKHGWDTFYYGNVSTGARGGGRGRGDAASGGAGGGGAARGGDAAGRATPTPEPVGAAPQANQPRIWATFEHVPRFHNNYVGMRNRFALLSEAYAYATFEDRIKATDYFVEESLNFAHANADKIKKTVEAADKESIIGTVEATRAQMKRGGMINVLMGEVEDEKNPNNGAVMNRRKDVVHPEQMVDMLWFEPSKTEDVPHEYYIPASATKAVELLKAHGIKMRQLTAPVRGVEQFMITNNTQRPANPNSIDTGTHGLRSLDGSWQAAPNVTAPAGTWVVDMNQPLARLAFYLIAPTSDDGLTTWNFLDDSLGADAKTYPILRKK
jgi:hypothetical protein